MFSAPVLSVYTVLFLKLWSYGDVNRWCRKVQSEENDVFLSKIKGTGKREHTPSRPSAPVLAAAQNSRTETITNSGKATAVTDSASTAAPATSLEVPHGKLETEGGTLNQYLRRRQRSVSPLPSVKKDELSKSPLTGKRRSASPNPQSM